jgi:hypothetical protein
MKLLLDNSALSLLHCQRKFQLTVVQGLRPDEAEEATATGSAGHTFLEHMDKGASVDDALSLMVAKHGSKDQDKILMAASMYRGANRMPPAITINGALAIEHKFKFHYGSFIRPESSERIEVDLCGTIDRIYIDAERDQLVFVDYKWSAAVLPAHRDRIMDSYDLSFQLPFYVHAMMSSGTFPAEYMAYLLDGHYRVELHFVFFNCDPPITKRRIRVAFSDDFIKREVPFIINGKVEEAIKIALMKDSAPHDGMLVYNACTYCHFKMACLEMGSEKEVEYLSRIPRRIYNPMEFR